MRISIIAACDRNNLIGIDGKMPWHIPDDLKRFKRLTEGHTVIMGRGTFESIGCKALPGRENIVISSHWQGIDNVLFSASLDHAINYCLSNQREEVFIIGGERVYREAMECYADRILLTRIDSAIDQKGSKFAYFPKIGDGWEIDSVDPGLGGYLGTSYVCPSSGLSYINVTYKRSAGKILDLS